jgi:hypothetical protein
MSWLQLGQGQTVLDGNNSQRFRAVVTENVENGHICSDLVHEPIVSQKVSDWYCGKLKDLIPTNS